LLSQTKRRQKSWNSLYHLVSTGNTWFWDDDVNGWTRRKYLFSHFTVKLINWNECHSTRRGGWLVFMQHSYGALWYTDNYIMATNTWCTGLLLLDILLLLQGQQSPTLIYNYWIVSCYHAVILMDLIVLPWKALQRLLFHQWRLLQQWSYA
jgi:hypothetical protein